MSAAQTEGPPIPIEELGPPEEPDRPKGGLFYGWYVVATVFFVQTVACGLGFYNLSVFLKAFVSDGGFSVTAVSSANAAFFLSNGVAGLAVGWALDRYDPRILITIGAIACSAALAFAGHVGSLTELYLFYVLFGAGYAATAVIPGTTIVARWFSRQRSKAIAYASTGLSLGGIIFTPISVTLIQTLGLQHAAYWLAFMFIIGSIPVTWFFLRARPSDMGLAPDGDPVVERHEHGGHLSDGVGFDIAIRSRFFIFCTIAFVFSMMAQVGALAHQFRLIAERTDNDHMAALAVSLMAAGSISGRLIGGWALSRVESKNYLVGVMVLQTFAYALFAITYGSIPLVVVSIMFGTTVGNMQMMLPLIMAEAFGLRAYARILSLAQMLITCANAFGPMVVGVLYERGSGYGVPFAFLVCMSVLGLAAMIAAGPAGVPARRPA